MTRPLVSVVMAAYQRGHLLDRSLDGYERSAGLYPPEDLELVVVDDGSTDQTRAIVETWSHRTGVRAVVLTPHPKRVGWRDCGAVLNDGIRAAAGEHVLITHPEVIPGRKSVFACVEQLVAFERRRAEARRAAEEKWHWSDGPPPECEVDCPLGLYVSCPVYYLSPREQELIDTVPWRGRDNLAVREIPGFYDEDANGNPDYSHRATDSVAQPGSRLPTWESWVFGGCSRETWKRLGGMLVSQKWGAVDVAFMQRRRALGVPTHTTPDPETIVVHQNHDGPDDVKTPRDMQAWVRELQAFDLTDPARLKYPGVDELGW